MPASSSARRAEREWGYDAIWLAETNGPDSFSLAGALAMATERATIGTAIVPVYNRTPAVLAMSAATVQQLSGGRFVLGLGSSSHAIIGDWNGVPFERPLAHVRESVDDRASGARRQEDGLRGRPCSARADCGSARARSQPVPIYLAALREKMLRMAGALGDGLIVNLFPVTALPQILAAYRAGAAEAGRDATDDEVVCRFQVLVTDDVPSARNLVRLAFGGYAAAPGLQQVLRVVRLRGGSAGRAKPPSRAAIARASPPRCTTASSTASASSERPSSAARSSPSSSQPA